MYEQVSVFFLYIFCICKCGFCIMYVVEGFMCARWLCEGDPAIETADYELDENG